MKRMPLIAALLVLACNDASDSVAPTDGALSLEPVAAASIPGQEQGIARLMDAQTAAWNAHDAVAYGQTYAEAATLIGPTGLISQGRGQITDQHAFLYNPTNGPFRGSSQSFVLRRLTFLTGKYAVVELDVALTGYASRPPNLPETEPGVVRTHVTWIAVKQGSEWKIGFQQMTPRFAP